MMKLKDTSKCSLCKNARATHLTEEGFFTKGEKTPICGKHKWIIKKYAFPITIEATFDEKTKE
jgi:hypothetical protein